MQVLELLALASGGLRNLVSIELVEDAQSPNQLYEGLLRQVTVRCLAGALQEVKEGLDAVRALQ